ncbi:5425_t:CDS:2, partial [Rhizophagus irregularis]
EILSLVGEEYKDIVLTELAEYVRKTGSFAHSHLWGDVIQKSVNWWNLMKGRYPILKKALTIESWVEKVLQKKAIREAAK